MLLSVCCCSLYAPMCICAHAGDGDHVDTVRTAVQDYKVHVCQLYMPNGLNGEWATGAGHDLVSWATSWPSFIGYHSRPEGGQFNMRESEIAQKQKMMSIVRSSLKFEEELGHVGIVLMLDITASMQSVIDEVKGKLESQLLVELHKR